MKKILSWLIVFILMATPSWSWAATRYARANGNWSATSTWNDVSCSDATETGTVPGNGDDVDLCDHTVVWDYATPYLRIPASGTLGTMTAATTGTLTITINTGTTDCDVKDDCSINFTTGTAGQEHLIQVLGTSTAADVTINATEVKASASTDGKNGILFSSGGTLWANTACTASSGGKTGDGCNISGTPGTGDMYIAGNITGGNTGMSYGAYNYGNTGSSITVNSGTVTGGSSPGAEGIKNGGNTAALVIASGVKLVDTNNGSQAISGTFTWNATSEDASYWKIGSKYFSYPTTKDYISHGHYVVTPTTGTREEGTATSSGGGGAWGF